MRWFSHWRSPSPLGSHAMLYYSLLLLAAYQLRHTSYYALSMGMTQQFFVLFCPWWPWPLTLTLKLRWVCTVPSFIILRLIVRNVSCRQTNTHCQTNRCHWQHPPRFATLYRWATRYSSKLFINDAHYELSGNNYKTGNVWKRSFASRDQLTGTLSILLQQYHAAY